MNIKKKLLELPINDSIMINVRFFKIFHWYKNHLNNI